MLATKRQTQSARTDTMLENDPRETAKRLEWLRHYLGLSQKEFASSIGVLPSTYSNWLHGQHGLSLDGARRIKQLYDISLDFLFFGDITNMPDHIRNAWEFRPPD
mgnify:CR=1 FL=1